MPEIEVTETTIPPHGAQGWACKGGTFPIASLDPRRIRQPVAHGRDKGMIGVYAFCPLCLAEERRAWHRIAVEPVADAAEQPSDRFVAPKPF